MDDLVRTLEDELAQFDGKALTVLTEVKARYGDGPGFVDALVALAGSEDANIASGSTWLLKNHLEKGNALAAEANAAYVRAMPTLTGWQAELHACQSLQFMQIEEQSAFALLPCLDDLTKHDRPFLRAWALDGLVRVALQHETHRKAAMDALARATEDKAASVKARARKLEKLLARS